jgi:twinkle protein
MTATDTHKTCPDCGGHDCLTLFEDGGTYCHQCFKGKGNKHLEVFDQSDLTLEHRGYRGIDQKLAEKYNVQTGIDSNGKEVTRVYPYPHRPKVRILPKDFSKNKGFTNDHLLGMDFFNAGTSKKLTIVEGEDDWLAAIQMLGDRWPVVALPGAGSIKQVLKNPKCYNYFKSFDSLVISSDNDEAGDKTAEILTKAFPGKCYRVPMTNHNDPCEYLEAGQGSDYLYAWMNAKKYTPPNVLNTPDQFLSLYRDAPDHQYIPTGIEALDDKILGLMQGHFTVIKAPTGIGKSEFMRFLEYQMLKQGVPIAAWHLEETKVRTLLGLVSYELQDNLTRQDLIEEKGKGKEVEEAIVDLTKDENFYQFFLDDSEGADELCDQIRYFSEVCGCKFVFFEPIQDVITSSSEDSKEQALADLSVRLSKLAATLGVGIVTIAHTNDNGDPKYCKMIGQRASVIIDLHRNKDEEDFEEKNTTYLKVEKNRPASADGPAGCMLFDGKSFTLKEKLLPF